MKLTISFSNFWPSFTPANNFFLDMLRNSLPYEIEVVDCQSAQLVIWSVFPDSKIPKISIRGRKQIDWFYTGENIRPDFEKFDCNISFDYANRENSFRLPLWWMYLNWNASIDTPDISESQINPHKLHLPRNLHLSDDNSMSTFIGNMTTLRKAFIESIPDSFTFYGYGSAFNNRIEDKLHYSGIFDFNICFENSYFPGYHTEKLLHAWVMGSVPIYYGSKTVVRDFNRNAFLNLSNYANFSEFWISLHHLNMRQKLSFINSPLIEHPIQIDSFKEFIKTNISNQI